MRKRLEGGALIAVATILAFHPQSTIISGDESIVSEEKSDVPVDRVPVT